MQAFLVERDMSGSSTRDLTGLRSASARQALKMHEAGDRVRYVRSSFQPQDGRCLCLVEAWDADVVRQLNRDVLQTFDRIVPASDLPPQEQAQAPHVTGRIARRGGPCRLHRPHGVPVPALP